MERLTLADALASNDLESFIRQAEAEGVGPGDPGEFERRIAATVKAPPPEDRTSRSGARGGSPGK